MTVLGMSSGSWSRMTEIEEPYGQVDIDRLNPHPKNKELYGENFDVSDLVTSIEENGFIEAIEIATEPREECNWPENRIVSGHRRWEAAKQVGMEQVMVMLSGVDSIDKEGEIEYLIRENNYRQKTDAMLIREGMEYKNVKNFERGSGRTQNQVGKRIGMSGQSYRKGRTVAKAADGGNQKAKEQWNKLKSGDQSIHGAYTTVMQDDDDDGQDDDDDDDEPETQTVEVTVSESTAEQIEETADETDTSPGEVIETSIEPTQADHPEPDTQNVSVEENQMEGWEFNEDLGMPVPEDHEVTDELVEHVESVRDEHEVIQNHESTLELGELRKNWDAYGNSINHIRHAKCPECGNGVEHLTWDCHGDTIPEAYEKSHEYYQKAIDEAPDLSEILEDSEDVDAYSEKGMLSQDEDSEQGGDGG